MAGDQEHRLRSLIAGNRLDEAIDDELDQWLNAQTRLHEVGAALIEVSTPVSENFGADTVKGALDAFKAVGEKVKERADDIQQVHDALKHAVTVTRAAQKVVVQMDGDTRDKPEFPPTKPGDDEADEIHNLKVYSGQMNLYNSWSTERETTSQQHADKVETAWKDAIAVMEKIPDDQQPGGGSGGSPGGGGGTSPVTPVSPTPTTPPTTPFSPPTFTPTPTPVPPHPPTPTPVPPTPTPTPTPHPTPVPPHHTTPDPLTPVVHVPATPHHPGTVPVGGGLDPYPGGTPYGPTGPVPSGGAAPTPAVAPGSLSGYAVGGVAGAGILGGLGAGLRAAGVAGASGGLRSGGVLGASGRTAGSARGTLGTAGGRGGSMAGGAASGGTGRGGSRGSAGRRGAGGAGGSGSGSGKNKDKKKRQPPTVELFDEDRDWIDDEGASSGVID